MAEDCLESPSEVQVGSGHCLSCLVHPSSHREVGGFVVDAVGTRNLVGVMEGRRSPLVRVHHSRSSLAHPTHLRGWDCMVRIH